MIRVNQNVLDINRRKGRYSPTDVVRLHASERDQPFDRELWNYFVNSLKDEDVRFYPNVDHAYNLLAQLTGFNKESLTIAEGSDRVLKNLFQCFAVGKVLTTNPSFPMYQIYAHAQGVKLVTMDYTSNKFPFTEFLNAIDRSVGLVIISNPSSPVGDSLTADQIETLAKKCKRTNSLLVVDEAYIEFSDLESSARLVESYNVVTVRTLSKAYGSAGARIGYSISSPYVKHVLDKLSSMNEVSGFSVKWLEALFLHSDADRYVNAVKQNRKALTELLESKGIMFIDSKTNYVNVLGKIEIEGMIFKYATMPWDNNLYTRISVPGDLQHFDLLAGALSNL